MDRVVFLDRDGTLNEEVHYLHRTSDLKLLPGVPEALRMLKEAGYRLVVVTNQAGVARGYYGEEDVKKLHIYMNHILECRGRPLTHFITVPIIRSMESAHIRRSAAAASRVPVCLRRPHNGLKWISLIPL